MDEWSNSDRKLYLDEVNTFLKVSVKIFLRVFSALFCAFEVDEFYDKYSVIIYLNSLISSPSLCFSFMFVFTFASFPETYIILLAEFDTLFLWIFFINVLNSKLFVFKIEVWWLLKILFSLFFASTLCFDFLVKIWA